MDNETVIKLLTGHKNDIKDLMEGQSAIISARVDAKFDQKFAPLEAKVDSIVEHNDRQNGWITAHTLNLEANKDRVDKLEDVCEQTVNDRAWAKKRWYVIVIAIAAISLLTSWSFHNVNLIKTIEKKFNIELMDNK